MIQTRSSVRTMLLLAMVLMPALAQAHSGGLPGHTHGDEWLDGALHPLLGMDHLLAMIAVGLWAAQLRGRALWLVPTTFVSVMVAGGLLGQQGMSFPGLETGVLGSVFVLALLLIAAVRLPLAASAVIAGLFAFFHGAAHGLEMPAHFSPLTFTLGFVFSTALLHLAGLGLGMLLQREASGTQWMRSAGVAVLAGACLIALN